MEKLKIVGRDCHTEGHAGDCSSHYLGDFRGVRTHLALFEEQFILRLWKQTNFKIRPKSGREKHRKPLRIFGPKRKQKSPTSKRQPRNGGDAQRRPAARPPKRRTIMCTRIRGQPSLRSRSSAWCSDSCSAALATDPATTWSASGVAAPEQPQHGRFSRFPSAVTYRKP